MKHLLISSPSNSSEDQIVIVMQESTATPTGLFHHYDNQNATDALSSSKDAGVMWSPPVYVALALIFILGVITFVGNILIVVSVVKFKRLQIPPNYILVNLAIADLGVAVMTLLLFGFKFLRSGEQGGMVCLVPYCLMSLFSGVSVLNLSVIAYDRFSALVEPLKYSTRITSCHITVICMAVWIYMGLISTIPLITWNVTDHDRFSSNVTCTINFYQSYTTLAQVIAVFLPAIVCMFFCYCRVMLVARHHTRAISAVKFSLSPGVLKSYNSSFKGSKYWRTLALILGVFTITWGTFTATVVIEVFCKQCADFLSTHNYSGLLLLLNSSLNPWIYAFRNKDFRAAFKRMVRCLRRPCKRKLARSNSSLVSERRNSHMSIALSRTNSLCGNLQAMQMLYEQEMALKNNNQPNYKDSEVDVETAQTSVNNSKLSIGKDIERDPDSPTPPTPTPQQKAAVEMV